MLRPCRGLSHYNLRRCYAFLDVYLKQGIVQRQAITSGLVAIGVIGEGGVDDAAGDRRHRSPITVFAGSNSATRTAFASTLRHVPLMSVQSSAQVMCYNILHHFLPIGFVLHPL